ncbi:glycosyltransferase [Cobetia sp. L2A1]|uniref:glycosyltransferase n=1 Tax=Cobetia sp. L2A1 TaxID=2686360 RepID=UPI00131C168E|nr:glycosyltransferase [Cobetia sp. L2A1]
MKTHRLALFISSPVISSPVVSAPQQGASDGGTGEKGGREQGSRETRQMLALAAGLTRMGHEVDLVVQQANESIMAALAHGVRLVELGSQHRLTSVLALTRYLARHRPCVLLASGLDANLMALKAGHLNRGRVPVVVYHAALISSEWHALGDRANGLRCKMALKYPRAALALSANDDVTREILREGGVSRTRVALVNLNLAPAIAQTAHVTKPETTQLETAATLSNQQLMQCLGLLLSAAGVTSSAQAVEVGAREPERSAARHESVTRLESNAYVNASGSRYAASPASLAVKSPRAVMAESSERD